MKQNKKNLKYLLGGNLNFIGTIVAISKAIRKNKKDSPGYSILIYFDHYTGQIERYLYNPNLLREEIYFNEQYTELEELENKKKN
jgi:hypothetical protein